MGKYSQEFTRNFVLSTWLLDMKTPGRSHVGDTYRHIQANKDSVSEYYFLCSVHFSRLLETYLHDGNVEVSVQRIVQAASKYGRLEHIAYA